MEQCSLWNTSIKLPLHNSHKKKTLAKFIKKKKSFFKQNWSNFQSEILNKKKKSRF